MSNLRNGSIPLFRLFGISVYLHWSWFLIAYLILLGRPGRYFWGGWAVIEYLSLFGIVLLHEFGHALACRSVGGKADQIILWPLGGIAFVEPPQRPGAVLWSIVAGPLVNLVLVPITFALLVFGRSLGWQDSEPDLNQYLETIAAINGGLLVFNLLPIYPLDGGQILQAILWFVMGRATSLMVASILGLIAGIGLGVLALLATMVVPDIGLFWFGILAVFIVSRAWLGFRVSQALLKLELAPRHAGASCPECGAAPVKGPFWQCDECHERFDVFKDQGACPRCGTRMEETVCIECRHRSAIAAWIPVATPADVDQAGHTTS